MNSADGFVGKAKQMKGGKQPTARQKRWHDWLGQQMCCDAENTPCENLHHAVGTTGKHNKVWIGQDFVLPITAELNHNISLTLKKDRKPLEKLWFFELVEKAKAEGFPDIPPDEVLEAIMDYRI